MFRDALLRIVDDIFPVAVSLRLAHDLLAPELELLGGDELERVEVDEDFVVEHHQYRPFGEGLELVLPSLDNLEVGPLRVLLSEQLDDRHLFVLDWQGWDISIFAID